MNNFQNKANLIATIFEGETCSHFDLCCEDEEFKNLFIDGVKSNQSIIQVANILTSYANENLI
tara:strand:- start:770 stop:958 length:189 start_codon:yes stop_codon:yes gene_type:complete